MERKLEQLVKVLEQTRDLYERMLALILEEKAAATASDFERFSRVSEEKEGLVAQLKQTEQRRDTLLHTIAAALDIPLQQLNVSTLVKRVDTPCRLRLKTVASELKSSVSRVRIANRECCMIIEHCLGLVTRSMGFFQHWLQMSAVYGQNGNICTGNRSGGRLVSDTV
jgi:flagellar biosynthesis/type III secretory pathway chaperone